MASRLWISLLGAPSVERDGEAVTFPTRKALALLAVLAVTPGPQSRSVLAASLWPELDEQHSAGALRYTLAVLKKALGDGALAVSRARVELATGPETSDVGQFLRCLDEVQAHGHRAPELCPACLAALARAAQLSCDDFLTGFTLRDSPAFDEWQLAQRQRFQRGLASALERLVAAYVARHDWAPALEHARRWAALDPLHEPAQRLLMQIYAWSGRRSAAMRQYQACARLLAAELGVEPAEETRALYEAIRARQVAPPPRPAAPAAAPAPEPETRPQALPPLVARQGELRHLHGQLDLAVAGRGRLCFVAGEAGSGKTALLQAFAQDAVRAHPRLVVAAASCNAYTGVGDPLRPFRALVGALAGGEADATGSVSLLGGGGARGRLAAAGRRAIAAAGPGFAATFLGAGDGQGPEPGAGAPPDRHALFAQCGAVFRRLAARRPLLLILDDLQWADSASLDLLFQLSREIGDSAICIVGAYRPADIAPAQGRARHPLEPLLHEVARAQGAAAVDLDRAAEESGQAFVDAVVATMPNRLGDDFRRALLQQTAGHPLFTVELLRGLQERGDLALDEGGCWVTSPALDWSLLPARVEGIIAERIARLDEGLRETLQIASVEGEVFSAQTIAFVQATDERGVVRALSGELERRQRLVRAVGLVPLGPGGLARYRFRHLLFQQYLYRQLDPVERAMLHGDVGAALERLVGEQAEAFAVELARHFAEAGQTFKAARYLLLAGQRALRLTAGDEAVEHLRRGIALLQAVPLSAERAWHESQLQTVLGAALTQLRGQASPEAAAAFGQAHQLSVRGGGRELFVALWGRKSVHDIRAEYRAALAITDQLEAMVAAGDTALLQPAVDSARGVTLFYVGQVEPARHYLERAIAGYDPQLHQALALQHGTDVGIVASAWLAGALWEQGFPEQARRQSAAALALARRLGHRYSEVYALTIGARSFQRGREALATLRWADEALALIPPGQFAMFHALATIWRAWAVAVQGDPEGGVAAVLGGREALRATGARMSEPAIQVLLAGLHAGAGRRDEALDALERAQAEAEQTDTFLELVEVHRLRGELLAGHDAAGAEVEARRAIDLARGLGARLLELRATVTMARLLGRQGRPAEALALLAPCYARFTEGFDAPDLRAAREALVDLPALAQATSRAPGSRP